ncbi:MAG TPA: hypothetical protein PKI19_13440 [Elusimicrobiales bacterium]|nr:hypothetical protein [Elusimicrobiales bacterium]
MRDGAEKGEREGRREGYAEGINAGEREGRDRGIREGDTAGRNSGIRDGWNIDQSAGTQRGNADGQNTGISNGTAAGQKRCYDAGYTDGYNSAYATAKQSGLQDAASYNAGYAQGQADASAVETGNGQKAGYQAGFSQREAELEASFTGISAMKGVFTKGLAMGEKNELPIGLVRNGYTTPEERRAYEEAFQESYRRTYRRSYDDAKRDGYNERFQLAYRRAYDAQFSISYRNGFAEGKERGYQEAYQAAYNSMYNYYFNEYSSREYADQRAQGRYSGQTVGTKDGFAAGCAEQTQLGYKAGYERTAAAVYPGAFEAGKQAGIAAADRYYSENAVLKVFNISFYDENNNGKFEASENVMMKAEVRNFGFQRSDALAIVVRSERGEITLVPGLRGEGVSGRANSVLTFNVGRLYDVVAPDADALYVTFSEKGKLVGDLRQAYSRTNANKVGVVGSDGADVTKKDTWFFPGKITSLNGGEKVIITETKGSYYKVRKSEVSGGNWTEGYIKSDKLSLQ